MTEKLAHKLANCLGMHILFEDFPKHLGYVSGMGFEDVVMGQYGL